MSDALRRAGPETRAEKRPAEQPDLVRYPAGHGMAHRPELVPVAVRLADGAVLLALGSALGWLRYPGIPIDPSYWFDVILTVLSTELVFSHLKLHDVAAERRAGWLARLAIAWSCICLGILGLNRALGLAPQVAALWSFGSIAPGLLGFAAIRFAAARYLTRLRRAGKVAVDAAIVGSKLACRRLVARLAPRLGTDLRLLGVYELSAADWALPGDLLSKCRTGQLGEIFVALEFGEAELLDRIRDGLRSFAIDVHLVPELPVALGAGGSVVSVCGLPSVALVRHPLSRGQRVAKRVLDVILASAALAGALPLMLLIAVAIRLETPGPALFRQERWGFNAGAIRVLKFRTMRVDAGKDATVPQARRGDPRVTRIGGILRRTSLDELPQLLNVLRGDMSLVGPRPHAVSHNEFYGACIDGYLARHRVKPGITGLAQVNGCRGETDTLDKMRRRVEYDLLYIENWSLWLDLKILCRTLFVGFVHANAY